MDNIAIKKRKDFTAFWFIIPSVVLVLFVAIFPLFYSLYISFHQYNIAKPMIPFKLIWFDNYINIFTDIAFWNSLKLTLIFVIGAVAIELIIGLALALVLASEIRNKNIFRTLILLPMVISPVVVGLIGRFMTDDSIGMVNIILRGLGFPNIVWFGNPKLALISLIILDIWEWTPFIFLILLAGLMAISKEVYEAAKIDGASYFKELRYIVLPMLRPIIFLALILRVIDSFKEFDKVWSITKGGPTYATNLLVVSNFRVAFKEFNTGEASAFSWIILIIFIAMGTFLVRQIKREAVK